MTSEASQVCAVEPPTNGVVFRFEDRHGETGTAGVVFERLLRPTTESGECGHRALSADLTIQLERSSMLVLVK